MKLKLVVVDLEISPRAKRWALRLGIPLVVFGVCGIALATTVPVVGTYAAGKALTKADLDANFQAVESRLSALEASAPTMLVTFSWNGSSIVTKGTPKNVASVTRQGVGQYTINFTTAYANTDYLALGSGGGSIRNNTLANVAFPATLYQTGSLAVDAQYAHSTSPFDPAVVTVVVFSR